MKGGDIMKTTIASLKCVQCENSFPFNLNEKPSHITCPFCQTEVENDMIEQIYDAANTVGEVNKNFRSYADEYSNPVFELSVKEKEVALPVDNN
ncbi:hypothetical protein P0W59_002069 [Listeria monocytogenes]|nr:hypothetical protein [Listeria monocytogenes]EKO5688558.1 hypothetical protein [Listeria monocytogenes]